MKAQCPDCRADFGCQQYVLPAVRRVYLDTTPYTNLQKKLEHAENRNKALKKREEELIKQCERYQAAASAARRGETSANAALDGFLANQKGATGFHDVMSVVEIKAKAREAVQKEARGAPALSLIWTARAQLLSAKDYERKGDLRSALRSFIKAASLAKMTIDSAEYSQEGRSTGGVLKKELTDFLSVCLNLITFHPFSDGFVFTRAMGAI